MIELSAILLGISVILLAISQFVLTVNLKRAGVLK